MHPKVVGDAERLLGAVTVRSGWPVARDPGAAAGALVITQMLAFADHAPIRVLAHGKAVAGAAILQPQVGGNTGNVTSIVKTWSMEIPGPARTWKHILTLTY